MVSNDAVIAYRGEEFELTLIHYYRAMNYARLGDRQAALVECRKANLKLEDYAQQAEYELSYKNDAFLQYMTGLFFESEGEWNDAYISYKDALKGYRAYEEAFGSPVPHSLLVDLTRLADFLGYEDDVQEYLEHYQLAPEELRPASGGEIVAFVESAAFVPRKHQVEFNMPILKGEKDAKIGTVAEQAVHRFRHPDSYKQLRVDYWLRVALPKIPGGALASGRGAVAGGQPERDRRHRRGLSGHCPTDLCREIRLDPATHRRARLGQVFGV